VVEVEGVGREEARSLYEARDLLLLMLRPLKHERLVYPAQYGAKYA